MSKEGDFREGRGSVDQIFTSMQICEKTELHRVPMVFQYIYMDAVMKRVKLRMGRRGESGDYLASCMLIT